MMLSVFGLHYLYCQHLYLCLHFEFGLSDVLKTLIWPFILKVLNIYTLQKQGTRNWTVNLIQKLGSTFVILDSGAESV
jgi:hypothetical protein